MFSKILKCVRNPLIVPKYVWNRTLYAHDKLRATYVRWRVKDQTVSLIAQDCTGGILLHSIGMRFNSPTVNLFFPSMDEYLTYVEHLKDFSDLPVEEIDCGTPYPCGVITHKEYGKVHLHFMHYHSFAEAADKWRERSRRINFANVRVIMTLKTPDASLLKRFDAIGLPSVVITFPDVYPHIKNVCKTLSVEVFVLPWHGATAHGEFLNKRGFFGRRPICAFNIISFLNKPFSRNMGN